MEKNWNPGKFSSSTFEVSLFISLVTLLMLARANKPKVMAPSTARPALAPAPTSDPAPVPPTALAAPVAAITPTATLSNGITSTPKVIEKKRRPLENSVKPYNRHLIVVERGPASSWPYSWMSFAVAVSLR